MGYSTLFFDLDDTLYPNSNGLWSAIRERMAEYLRDCLGFPPETIPDLRRHYFETYGTTLRGLQIHHQVDPDRYLAYVHDLPLEKFIAPDAGLRRLLDGLRRQKWIFTNSDRNHAGRVLSVLGLTGCFDGIIDVRALDFSCKPDPEAYWKALNLAGESDPHKCVLLDDAPRNLAPAKDLGFTTVLVGTDDPHPTADLAIRRINDLPVAFPQLWALDY